MGLWPGRACLCERSGGLAIPAIPPSGVFALLTASAGLPSNAAPPVLVVRLTGLTDHCNTGTRAGTARPSESGSMQWRVVRASSNGQHPSILVRSAAPIFDDDLRQPSAPTRIVTTPLRSTGSDDAQTAPADNSLRRLAQVTTPADPA